MTIRALVCGLMLSGGSAWAGVTLVTEESTGDVKKQATVMFDADHLRAEGTGRGDAGKAMIFDLAAQRMVVLDAEKKAYVEMTAEDMKRMQARMGAAMEGAGAGDPASRMTPEQRAQMDAAQAQMAERMKSMTPEQRAQVEAVMAQHPEMGRPGMGPGMRHGVGMGGGAGVLKFDALGEKKKVNGFACEMYKVTRDGEAFEEDCIASWQSVSLTKEDLAVFKKLGEAFAGMMGAGEHSSMHEWSKYPGFPVLRTRTLPGGIRHESTLKSVKHGALAADIFGVPAGYSKEQPWQMHGGPGRRN